MSRELVCVLLLLVMGGAAAPASHGQRDSPRDVLERFCELDSHGKQLSDEGWHQIALLFVTPTTRRRDKIIVVRDFVVSHPDLKKNRAEFYVEYIQLGKIDLSRGKFHHLPSLKVRAGFNVVLTDQWRIEGSPPEPHLTVDSAILFLSDLRNQTNDDLIRKNAERTIAALKQLRP